MLHHILDVDGIEWNGAAAQLRYVETLQAIIVEGWFLLRQYERLVSFALTVYVAEVRLAVKSVVTFAGKDKPSAGMRPTVIGIALRIIYFQSLFCVGMKGWDDDVGREGDVFARRTETVIYTRRNHVGVFQVQLAQLAIAVKNS